MWSSVILLGLASAVAPTQILMTVVLLRSPHGVGPTVAFVCGLALMRLLQGLMFGLLLDPFAAFPDGLPWSDRLDGPVPSAVLLVVGVALLVGGVRALVRGGDDDAGRSDWLKRATRLRPGTAFAIGAGLTAIGVKFWLLTVAVIAVIGAADPRPATAAVAFLVFLVAALSVHGGLLGVAVLAPRNSDRVLAGTERWLARHRIHIVAVVGVALGAWLVVQGLAGLGA